MKLKNLLAIALLLSCASTSVFAQGGSSSASDGVVLENKSFWSNWFVGAGVGVMTYISENPSENMTITPAFEASLGKWFSPEIALRGRATYSKVGGPVGKFNFAMLSGDVMINAFNLFCGYDADRVFNLNPYASINAAASGAGERIGGSLGVNATYALSSDLDLTADVKGGILQDGLDYYISGSAVEGYAALTVGVNYKFNPKGWTVYSPKVIKGGASSAELDAIRAELRKSKAKVNDLNTELEISEAKLKAKTGMQEIDAEREAYFNSIK